MTKCDRCKKYFEMRDTCLKNYNSVIAAVSAFRGLQEICQRNCQFEEIEKTEDEDEVSDDD